MYAKSLKIIPIQLDSNLAITAKTQIPIVIDKDIFLNIYIRKIPVNKPDNRAPKLAVNRMPVGLTKIPIKTPATIE